MVRLTYLRAFLRTLLCRHTSTWVTCSWDQQAYEVCMRCGRVTTKERSRTC